MTESQSRERLMARRAILAQNGLLPGTTVQEAEDQFLVEELKNSIVNDLHALEARIGKPATEAWLAGNYQN